MLRGVLAVGAIGTGVAYVINYEVMKIDGATSASMVLYLILVVAGILGKAILDGLLKPAFIVGTAAILLGVHLSRPTNRRNN